MKACYALVGVTSDARYCEWFELPFDTRTCDSGKWWDLAESVFGEGACDPKDGWDGVIRTEDELVELLEPLEEGEACLLAYGMYGIHDTRPMRVVGQFFGDYPVSYAIEKREEVT